MSRNLARIAVASLLVLAVSACSSDDDEKKDKESKAAQEKASIEKPQSDGGCSTRLMVQYSAGDERKSATMVYPAAVGLKNGSELTLFASDATLDLNALPESPRDDADAAFLTVQLSPAKKGKIQPLKQGTNVDPAAKAKDDYDVAVSVLQGSDVEHTDNEDASGQIRVVEMGAKEGDGLCVRIRYNDSEKSVNGTLFAPLTLADNPL